jgi:hypothetical protein
MSPSTTLFIPIAQNLPIVEPGRIATRSPSPVPRPIRTGSVISGLSSIWSWGPSSA